MLHFYVRFLSVTVAFVIFAGVTRYAIQPESAAIILHPYTAFDLEPSKPDAYAKDFDFREFEKIVVSYLDARQFTPQAILRFDADMHQFLVLFPNTLNYSPSELDDLIDYALGVSQPNELAHIKEVFKYYIRISSAKAVGELDIQKLPYHLRAEFSLLINRRWPFQS